MMDLRLRTVATTFNRHFHRMTFMMRPVGTVALVAQLVGTVVFVAPPIGTVAFAARSVGTVALVA